MYIKSESHYLYYYVSTQDHPFIERNSLAAALAALPEELFIQIHRCYAVNLNFIKALSAATITLKNDERLNISRTYKSNLKELFPNNQSAQKSAFHVVFFAVRDSGLSPDSAFDALFL